jgi:prepilin-type N-terminal cleavage/methylation domain-containing protein
MPLPTPSSDRSGPVARRGAPRLAARGFTLLEMMVTIGILLVLMGIITVGLSSVIGGNQRRQTETILKRAQAFTAEISNSKQARDSFYQRVMWRTCLNPPYNVPSDASPPSPNNIPVNLSVPVTAVSRSCDVMSYLLSIGANKAIAEKLPPRSTNDLPSAYQSRFAASDGKLLANVMLDAWGNPIIFVADGFESLNSAGVVIPQANMGGLTGLTSSLAAPQSPFRAPDRRPFWFSAGPDGKYETHDDNIYSFN